MGVKYQTISTGKAPAAEARATEAANRLSTLRSLEQEHYSLSQLGDEATESQKARITEIEGYLPDLQSDPLVAEALDAEKAKADEAATDAAAAGASA